MIAKRTNGRTNSYLWRLPSEERVDASQISDKAEWRARLHILILNLRNARLELPRGPRPRLVWPEIATWRLQHLTNYVADWVTSEFNVVYNDE